MEDDTLPLDGKKIRVFADLILEAADHIRATRSEYATLVVAGGFAISLYTGKPKLLIHETRDQIEDIPPPRKQRAGSLQGRQKHQQKRQPKRRRKMMEPRDIPVETIIKHFQSEPKRELSAKTLGDMLGLQRGNLAERGALSRVLAELRLSGIIRPTSKSRIPDYVFSAKPTPLRENGAFNPRDITEDNVIKVLRDARRPLALAVISDMLHVPRGDRENRVAVAKVVQNLTDAGQVEAIMTDTNKMMIFSFNEAR